MSLGAAHFPIAPSNLKKEETHSFPRVSIPIFRRIEGAEQSAGIFLWNEPRDSFEESRGWFIWVIPCLVPRAASCRHSFEPQEPSCRRFCRPRCWRSPWWAIARRDFGAFGGGVLTGPLQRKRGPDLASLKKGGAESAVWSWGHLVSTGTGAQMNQTTNPNSQLSGT